VILFGEHFVVAGNAAIAMAVNLVNHVTASLRDDLKIRINSTELGGAGVFDNAEFSPENPAVNRELLEPVRVAAAAGLRAIDSKTGLNIDVTTNVPISVGLGSSASVAVATIGAVTSLLDRPIEKERIRELASESERLLHGNPSGIDQTIVTNGGVIRFQRGKGFTWLPTREGFSLLIGNTRIRRSTGTVVARVLSFRDHNPARFAELADHVATIVKQAESALSRGDLERLGSLMNENQNLLTEVGASSEELDRLITVARDSGAFGAKLTGAGGGGCMITVAHERSRDKVTDALKEHGAEVYDVSVDTVGLKSWREPDSKGS
jgi:mevalonate kinase